MYLSNPLETLHHSLAHAAYEAFSQYHYKDRDWAKHDTWRSSIPRDQLKTAVAPDSCFVDKVRKHTPSDVTVNAMFPQTWGSTALGFGGIGGQAISSAYVCVLESNLVGEVAVYFGGRLAYVIKRPNNEFYADVRNTKMVDAKDGVAKYERTN